MWRKWLIFIGSLWLLGCTPPATKQFLSQSKRPTDAVLFFQQLDQAVDKAEVVNRRSTKIPGFPYLAADRFLESRVGKLTTSAAFDRWLEQMADLSRDTRQHEIQNLPQAEIDRFFYEYKSIQAPTRKALLEQSQQQAIMLSRSDRRQAGFAATIQSAVQVPDDYSTTLRVVGLYPVAILPVAYFSDGFFDQLRAWHQIPPDQLRVFGQLTAYRNRESAPEGANDLESLFRPSNRDPLGLPLLSHEDRLMLVRRFAPVIVQDNAATYDRIGQVKWQEPETLHIDSQKPTAYYYLSNAYLKGKPIWQINYVFWYSGRLGENTPWFERGLIDGITLRVSLDQKGSPFMIDLMNSCGCSHQFFPRKDRVAELLDRSMMFDALVPAWLPDNFPEKPVQIRVNSGWHQVQHIGVEADHAEKKLYELRPYEDLESLPLGSDQFRSMFDEKGIAFGSDRVEPYFFFPMGIHDVGAMRQRGHHPIALIGRSHFDEPDLFDLYFSWKSEGK